MELRFRVEIEANRIIGRYVDLIESIGMWRGREVEFGKDLMGIRRIEKTDEIVTALVGVGPEPEDGPQLEVFVEDRDALNKMVYLSGLVRRGEVGTTITVLPAGCRPLNTEVFNVGKGGTGQNRVYVYSDGRVVLNNGSTSFTS